MQIDFKSCREEIAGALQEFCNRWCKREHVESNALKLHTLQLSLKQINKILGQIEGYSFFWPFCSEKKNM